VLRSRSSLCHEWKRTAPLRNRLRSWEALLRSAVCYFTLARLFASSSSAARKNPIGAGAVRAHCRDSPETGRYLHNARGGLHPWPSCCGWSGGYW
jgi:hypothetical protein